MICIINSETLTSVGGVPVEDMDSRSILRQYGADTTFFYRAQLILLIVGRKLRILKARQLGASCDLYTVDHLNLIVELHLPHTPADRRAAIHRELSLALDY